MFLSREIFVCLWSLPREKEDTCFFLLIKSRKHFPLRRVDFPLINCKIFPLTFNYFLSYLKPKNVKCFPFHQKKWSISMYKLPQKWNMKSKIRKPYLYLILSLQAKYCLQDGQVQIFPLWSMTSICNQLIYIYTIKFTPTNWQIYTLRSLGF